MFFSVHNIHLCDDDSLSAFSVVSVLGITAFACSLSKTDVSLLYSSKTEVSLLSSIQTGGSVLSSSIICTAFSIKPGKY